MWRQLFLDRLRRELQQLVASRMAIEIVDPRERLRALVEALMTELNKASSTELGEFKAEFLASLSALDDAAKKGTEDATSRLQEIAKAAEKAATEAKAAAEKVAGEAKAMAKAVEDAAKPGALNVTVTGDFDGQVTISIDGTERVRNTGKILAIDKVPPGLRTLNARAQKWTKDLEASFVVDVKPGLQAVSVSLG